MTVGNERLPYLRSPHSGSGAASPGKDLGSSIEGCTHVNLAKLATEHFTPDFLERAMIGYARAVDMMESLGMLVVFNPSELDKCIIHYCNRELIKDMWSCGKPVLERTLGADGRFDLQRTLEEGDYGRLTDDITHNLDIGRAFILRTTSEIHTNWVTGLRDRQDIDKSIDPLPLMYIVNRYFNVAVRGGSWDEPTVLENTFTSAGREMCDWMADHPNLTREELEEIMENSVGEGIQQASQLGVRSTAKEQVLRDVTSAGGKAYVLDQEAKKVTFNPDHLETIKSLEDEIRERYHDQTQLLLKCPALFVQSDLFPTGSMLHDLIRYRFKVYVEIYLATQNIRKYNEGTYDEKSTTEQF